MVFQILREHKAKKLKRRRVDVTVPYVYFPAGMQWNQKVEHYLALNWVYIALVKQIKQWFKLQAFVREYFCQWGDGHLLADALAVLNNTTTKKLRPVFIEVDRGSSNNRFDKVTKYTAYYQSKEWVQQWWAQLYPEGRYRFPRVLVITDRRELVNKIIEKENKVGIRFTVLFNK